jgi:hypothetical protein
MEINMHNVPQGRQDQKVEQPPKPIAADPKTSETKANQNKQQQDQKNKPNQQKK